MPSLELINKREAVRGQRPDEDDPEEGDMKRGTLENGDPEEGDMKRGTPEEGDPEEGETKMWIRDCYVQQLACIYIDWWLCLLQIL